ncbi:hypothetical protein ACN6K5_000895 [Streptomyces violaceoruber]|uniref:hypothetical protein n=1 Tax=Streptomyces violaceoruber TaxID=1935 RepID=UPI00403CB0BF
MSDTPRTRPALDQLSHPIHTHVFAIQRPTLAAAIDDEFTGIDPIEITGDVLNRTPRKHHLTVIHALDDVFGDLGDDFEDGDE